MFIDKHYEYGTWVDPSTKKLFDTDEYKIRSLRADIRKTEQALRTLAALPTEVNMNGALEKQDEVLHQYQSVIDKLESDTLRALRALQTTLKPHPTAIISYF